MSTKYTPKPWTLDTRGYTFIVSKRGDGYITRDVCRMDGSTMAAFHQKGNARLIAAAPDLLEALQFVMVAHGEQLTLAFEMAQAAIAKATGEPT